MRAGAGDDGIAVKCKIHVRHNRTICRHGERLLVAFCLCRTSVECKGIPAVFFLLAIFDVGKNFFPVPVVEVAQRVSERERRDELHRSTDTVCETEHEAQQL